MFLLSERATLRHVDLSLIPRYANKKENGHEMLLIQSLGNLSEIEEFFFSPFRTTGDSFKYFLYHL